jgi:hypothetical protein
MELHYRGKTYELCLFDSYWITTKCETSDDDIESILNSMQEGDTDNWMKEFNIHFTVTQNGENIENIDVNEVHNLLLNEEE